MKKAISLITAAALAAGTLGTLTASAHQADDDGWIEYMKENRCYYYLDVDGGDATTKLSDEFIYVNKNKIKNDGEVLDIAVYLASHTQMVSDVIIHLCEDSGKILMRNGYDPVEKYGATPFKNYNKPGQSTTYKPEFGHPNGMSMKYQSLGFGFYELTKDKTDDYPVGCFDMLVPKDVDCGSYNVTVARPEDQYNIHIVSGSSFCSEYASEDDPYDVDYSFNGNNPDLQINVSDRDLGDADNNNTIDDLDGKDALTTYTHLENAFELPDNLTVACDVNGDRVIDDNDAEIILDYSLLYGEQENPELSFEEYVIGLVNE